MRPIFVPKLFQMQFFLDLDYNLKTYLFFTFLGVACIQLVYILFVYGRLAFYKQIKDDLIKLPPVTVLISARNDSDNLYENLPSILEQDYPNYEVIVINHQSIDESYHILNAYVQKYAHLKVIEVERSHHLKPGKKLPLTLGIKKAQHEHLLFTDADCKPNSKYWLQEMASCFTTEKEIVLGYGPYMKEKGFLNKVIRFDTAWIGMNYLSLALAKSTYMGVGRNLAYTKSLFNSVNGFKSHYSIASGDDDLFIQETTTKRNTAICISPESFNYSEAEKTWESWFKQKARHYTTSERYKVFKKAMLGIYPLTTLFLLISFVILMLDINFRWISLSVLGGIVIIKWWIQARCFKKLQEPGFVPLLPFIEIIYTLLLPILYYSTNKKEATKW
jgi:poly-beta-1,6-N-acetyl-D-glucosamine synthase